MKKNIAIIIPKLTGGGAERVAANLSLNLSEKFDSHVIVYDDRKITYDYSGKLLCINDDRKFSFIGKIFSLFKRVKSIKKLKKEYKIETSVSFMENPNFVNILSDTGDKVIISVRIYKSKSPNDLYGRINKFFMRMLYNKADFIVAVSEVIRKDLINNFGINSDKIKVIYNSYDVERIRELGLQPIKEEDHDFFKGKVITNMGRLEHQKGQVHLIKAFAKVKQDIVDAKLLIIGQGSLEEKLKELTKILGVENDVKFIGYTPNPFRYIRRSTLFVFPSLYEGFPNALCEAMACGVPVISSDCKSGPREILCSNGDYYHEANEIEYADYGILVPVIKNNVDMDDIRLSSNEELLATAIKEMLSDDGLWKKYSEKALERVGDFSVKSINEQWNEIL